MSKTHVQSALLSSPGRFSAVCLYGGNPKITNEQIRSKAAQVIRYFEGEEQPDGLHVLVALDKSVLERPPASELGKVDGPFAIQTNHKVFIQIAAQTDVHRLYALRIVDEVFGEYMGCLEFHGGKILDGEEPFGFPENKENKGKGGAYQRNLAENLPESGSWIFFQRFNQNLAKFFDQKKTLAGRAAVVGAPPAAVPPAERATLIASLQTIAKGGPPTHLGLMEAHQKEIVRRGFPCRRDGQEGLAFVGVTAEFATIPKLLKVMTSGKDKDPLLEFIDGREGGIFFCPPNADSLDEGKSEGLKPTTVEPLSHVKHLFTYDTTSAFYRYLMRLKAYGLFDDADRPTAISKLARPHMDALYHALSEGNAGKEKEMHDEEEASFKNAEETNDRYAVYVTYG